MWPVRPEMTRDECRKCLRCLELDAYGSMVSVLRAQGPFTNEKQKLLQELAKVLHISNERHRAEVRRAVNDEKLATIAEQLNGPNTGIDWTLEGRRTIPLLPRLKARSAFTTLANSLSFTTAIANDRKPDRSNTVRQSEISTVIETESHPNVKIEEDLSIDTRLNNVETKVDNKVSAENLNLIENEKTDDKDMHNKANEKLKEFPQKRKCSSPLSAAPPNKILAVSEAPNHILQTSENKQASQITKRQNLTLITVTDNEITESGDSTAVSKHPSECIVVTSNKHVVTTSTCISNVSNSKTIVSTEQNRINTKVVPAITSCLLSINKIHSSSDTQFQDSISGAQKTQTSDSINSNTSSIKSSMTPITIQSTKVSNSRQTQSMSVYPGTTVSSGPGPPQVKVPITLMCKKLPSEQITTFDHQATAKTEALSKALIMGGKNLCVTSQHNANSINVQPHHISLNNGDQTKTMLPTSNSSQNAEYIKTNMKSGKAAVVSVVTRLRHDVSENKVLSPLFDSPAILNVESKTVIQNVNYLPKKECNNDNNTIDRESSLKIESMTISTSEEKQYRKNNDVNASTNSQVVSLVESLKPLESKEVLIRPKQVHDNIEHDIRIEKSEDTDIFDTMLESTNKNLQNLMDNNENCDLEQSSRSLGTGNKMDEHDDS
ncbi:hypothetical protein PUN28_004076 [Cardiocondyla obscurior]|uniref:ENT domain-containing protein n=1 Tax=Cardiocondyla obscurior TaxID=286306 RepID=A0AAW2GP43_9HYME